VPIRNVFASFVLSRLADRLDLNAKLVRKLTSSLEDCLPQIDQTELLRDNFT
jgi:hypothetical protein